MCTKRDRLALDVYRGDNHELPVVRQEDKIFANGRCQVRKAGHLEVTMRRSTVSTWFIVLFAPCALSHQIACTTSGSPPTNAATRRPHHALAGTPRAAREQPMTTNAQHIKRAREHLSAFEHESDPPRLREAMMALENVNVASEADALMRAWIRTEALTSWLDLIQVFDRSMDPTFDPNDVPPKSVTPPRLPNGVALQPDASPSLMPDPVLRAEYEKAGEVNRTKAERYRLQDLLRLYERDLVPTFKRFIQLAYTSSASEMQELKTAIESKITNPARKSALLELIAHDHPVIQGSCGAPMQPSVLPDHLRGPSFVIERSYLSRLFRLPTNLPVTAPSRGAGYRQNTGVAHRSTPSSARGQETSPERAMSLRKWSQVQKVL